MPGATGRETRRHANGDQHRRLDHHRQDEVGVPARRSSIGARARRSPASATAGGDEQRRRDGRGAGRPHEPVDPLGRDAGAPLVEVHERRGERRRVAERVHGRRVGREVGERRLALGERRERRQRPIASDDARASSSRSGSRRVRGAPRGRGSRAARPRRRRPACPRRRRRPGRSSPAQNAPSSAAGEHANAWPCTSASPHREPAQERAVGAELPGQRHGRAHEHESTRRRDQPRCARAGRAVRPW